MRRGLMMLLAGCMTAAVVVTGLAQPGPSTDRDSLARELRDAWLPLESGMAMSRSEGTPISAKYEIDNGTFQLSVYTASGDRLSEVIVDYSVGMIAKVDVLTDSGDLATAHSQQEAIGRATRALEAVTAAAVTANPGYRAVSAMPQLSDGHPVAEIVLVNGADWRIARQRLD